MGTKQWWAMAGAAPTARAVRAAAPTSAGLRMVRMKDMSVVLLVLW